MKRLIAAAAGLSLLLPGTAVAGEHLTMPEVRYAIDYTVLPFAQLLDAKRLHIARCGRDSAARVHCRVSFKGPKQRCAMTAHVVERQNGYPVDVRHLKCR